MKRETYRVPRVGALARTGPTIMNPFGGRPLIVFELANNHMGDPEHGRRVIDALQDVAAPFRDVLDFGFKLQYRHLDTFIHPDYQGRADVKYVKRFEETRLSDEQFAALVAHMVERDFRTVCTPFDEPSVDRVEAHRFDILKIASCSFTDWPLLEKIARTSRPIIASTAGSSLDDIDRVVSFFEHRGRPLALLHCVAEYPTEKSKLQLNQIDLLRARYPQLVIGFSTHERPDDHAVVRSALAKGARILEKHVGVAIGESKLNDYSASPEQVRRWLEAARETLETCGTPAERYTPSTVELSNLHALRRGVYAKSRIEKGERVTRERIFLAMPTGEGQLVANDLGKYIEFTAKEGIEERAPVLRRDVARVDQRSRVTDIVTRVKALLLESHTAVSSKAEIEISHHYGLDRFDRFGCTMLTIVNRAYCKKLIVMLPGQTHPEQFHEVKEETFHLLHGDLTCILDDAISTLSAGDVVTVERGKRHAFSSRQGAVLEEISSTHVADDSFYVDPAIHANKSRKTYITYWLG